MTNTSNESTSPLATFSRHARRGSATLATVTIAALGLAACGASAATTGGSADDDESASAAEISPVVLLGDSVAAQLAIPLREGLAESGARFFDATSTGGGNLVGPNSKEQWNALSEALPEAAGGTVIYQVTTYDWGTPAEQRAAYERLAERATDVDAELVLISMPPIEPDDFYQPHMTELTAANSAAQEVAADRADVEFLDAADVWGDDFARERDGRLDRSSDGIHVCPQGAARFTYWALERLADLDPGFTPAAPEDWANTGWADSHLFHGCG